MNDHESISMALMTQLRDRLGIDFEGYAYLEDEQGNQHLYFIAHVRGAKVFFDEMGQIWMPEAEIARATDMSKQAVRNAIRRLAESDLGDTICEVNKLFTTDRRGHKRLMAFYDEETVTAIITRSQSQSPKALEFLAERKQIIQTVRYLVHLRSMSERKANQALLEKLEESERHRLDAEYRAHWAEQDAMDARRELLESRYENLDLYEYTQQEEAEDED
jgi:hypothetical protein